MEGRLSYIVDSSLSDLPISKSNHFTGNLEGYLHNFMRMRSDVQNEVMNWYIFSIVESTVIYQG